jgi:hypothetical protein
VGNTSHILVGIPEVLRTSGDNNIKMDIEENALGGVDRIQVH